MDATTLARAHGCFNVLSGAWPLLHMPSFEYVFGPKSDLWLVRTVAGLLVANGITQLTARTDRSTTARTVGVGTAATLAAIDLAYAPSGRISRMYLLDAAVELAWIAVWSRVRRPG